MKRDLAVILMGSKVDYDHAAKIIEWLDLFGIRHELRIASAHKTPEKLLGILGAHEEGEANIVYIAIAGLSNALCGIVDFATASPVVTCPPPCEAFGGADIYSSLRMPPGVAPATILDPRNAALFVAKIFGAFDPSLRAKIREYHEEQRVKIDRDEGAIR
jgi:5-(carboxyamino)imidazole ribonucleotide mutase